jgi:poly(3-hydroxybutyrate) depolymerase
VVADISDNYCIDPKRIYASGKSNGGGFTAYMACRQDTTRIFAAFAPVSPALYNGTLAFSGCDPARPIPIITSHGVEDQTIPFDGRNDSSGAYGVGTATINVSLWREQWAVRNGCAETSNGSYPPPTDVTNPYANTTEYVWSCDAEIQAYTVSNLGHSWPTTQGLDSSGAPNNTASFNFTDPPLVDFFSKQTLPDWCFEA